ncbi:MAG: hypothetical protein KGV43_02905 [Arcobacter sp.]|nr:hypothetical protein [Arcobacter sp.]
MGKKGAMSIIDKSGTILSSTPFDLREYIVILSRLKQENTPMMVGIEKVSSMPKQGVKSMFSFGQRLGELEGMCKSLYIPYELVPPQQWQKVCKIKPKSTKQDIANQILNLYPNASLKGKRGGLLDGVSDSIGLAHYIRLKYT